ncbi:MAG: hypothetical protein NUW23_10550 [Firmicutes bacterium]|nr:hypothetical protein [Bacillota bacterium]
MKGRVEEDLFESQKDLFTGVSLVFFHTASIQFEGTGGEPHGELGLSKSRRNPHGVLGCRPKHTQ